MLYNLKRVKGLLYRIYRKTYHKDWNIMNSGLKIFSEFANIYGDSINDINSAEKFFVDFMKESEGQVIVDFLDSDNWDCIKDVRFDKQNELIYLFFRLPLTDPLDRELRRMAFRFDTYGLILKFCNIRFVPLKNKTHFAIVINGYTLKDNEINKLIKSDNSEKFYSDKKSSFFSTNFVRVIDGLTESMRVMKTPISSFWIIPKQLTIKPQDSERLIYLYNLNKLEKKLNQSIERLTQDLKKENNKEDIDDSIMTCGNKMRRIAESLFKLIMCFYHKQFVFEPDNYNKRLLGDITSSLKRNIYQSDLEKEYLGKIAAIANDLSHDSGNPVTSKDAIELFTYIMYFILDFKLKVQATKNTYQMVKKEKPSPASYIQDNLHKWSFIDEINKCITSESENGTFKIAIKETLLNINDNLTANKYLCKDGMIRNLEDNDESENLMIMNRNDVITLAESINQRIETDCENAGYSSSYMHVNIEIINYKQKAQPIHLFTFEEIELLMAEADNNVNNKLVIDEKGYAKIIQNISEGQLYPVSQETWCAGNYYVGKDSDLSDAEPSYHLCLKGWLSYLKTGQPYYSDCYTYIEDVDSVINEIMQYY